MLIGETLLTPLNFRGFCRHSSNVKKFLLDVSNFDFLSLCPFHTENSSQCQLPFPKRRGFNFEVRDKIGILLGFFVRNEQSERKPNFNTSK
jgi:hypothetical protein